MKIWYMTCDVNKYSGYFIKDENVIESIRSCINKGKIVDDWKPIKIRRDKEVDGSSNISVLWSIVGSFIVDEKAKKFMEKYFPGKFQFLKVIDDENKKELYLVDILEFIDAIDYEKSVLKIYLNTIIGGVDKYVFREDVLDKPIFKLILNNARMSPDVYVNDSFKNVINDIGLTGVVFEELYDSDVN